MLRPGRISSRRNGWGPRRETQPRFRPIVGPTPERNRARTNHFSDRFCTDATKPYEFIGFGAMDATKPYEFIGFGASKQLRNLKVVVQRPGRLFPGRPPSNDPNPTYVPPVTQGLPQTAPLTRIRSTDNRCRINLPLRVTHMARGGEVRTQCTGTFDTL